MKWSCESSQQIDFEFAVICFEKEKLTGKGFEFSTSFYNAYQFLVDTVLDYVGDAKLLFDEYGGRESEFQGWFF